MFISISNSDNTRFTAPSSSRDPIRDAPNTASALPRILTRRYPLVKNNSKYLEVGIWVSNYSSIQLLLGDIKGNEIILDMFAWMELIRKKNIIDQMSIDQFLYIGNKITVKCVMYKDIQLLTFGSGSSLIYMTRETMHKMCNYECCVDSTYSYLTENLRKVQEKYNEFAKILRQTSGGEQSKYFDASKIIMATNIFDKSSIIDCELAVICSKQMMLEN
ncbi:hypothetical protein M0804_013910 [Polistes exclamans]|nr:hypothetical protein M0804_013910 [Polistes exclamans]